MHLDELLEAIRAYHGSGAPNVEFTMPHTGTNSHTFGSYQSERWGAFFSDNPNFSKMYGNVAEYILNINHT